MNAPEDHQIQTYLQQAQQAMQQRQPEQALRALAQACQRQPENIDFYNLQAQIMVQIGQEKNALALFQRLNKAFSQNALVSLTLGNLYQLNHLPKQALQAYQASVALKPEQGETWSNIGWLHQQQWDLKVAEQAYHQALKYNSALFFAWNNLSTLKLEQGDLVLAQKYLDQCLNLAPEYAPAYVNQALLASAQGDFTQAQKHLQTAQRLEPYLPEAWREEICLWVELGQEKEACQRLEQALILMPEAAELHWLKSRLAWKNLDLSASNTAYQQAIRLAPKRQFWSFQAGLQSAQAHFLSPANEQADYLKQLKNHLLQVSQHPFAFNRILPELRYLPEMLWHLNYLNHPSLKEIKSLLAACILPPENVSSPKIKASSKPLKLGVLVTPGHEGIFNKLCAPLLNQLDPSQIQLTLIGNEQALEPINNSQYCKLPGGLLPAAQSIQALELELLYYWEVGSDIYNFYLPWFRLAPVQFTGWGTPQTTGLPDIDFYLSDRYTEPENAHNHYSETLILLPELPLYLTPPQIKPLTRQELDLPEQSILYVCLQNPMKYSPDFIETLRQLITQTPKAYLVLLQSREPEVQSRVNKAIQDLPQEQIICLKAPLPRNRYLNILQQASLVLDTWQYSGGQSTDEALALGAPVLTLAGTQARQRLSLGRLKQLGLQEMIAQTPDEYLEMALSLGTNPPKQQALRQKINQKVAKLLKKQTAPRQLEAALWQMAQLKGIRKAAKIV